MKYFFFLLLIPLLSLGQEQTTKIVINQKDSLEYHKQQLQEARRNNHHEEQARLLLKISRILKEKDANKSLEHLKEALTISKHIHHHQLTSEIYRAMVEIYKDQENYEEAIIALEEHQKLLDSLFRLGKEREIAKLKVWYELQNSRIHVQNLQLLNKKRTLERNIGLSVAIGILIILFIIWYYLRNLNKLNKQLEISNTTKDKLFSIIGHDLRGPIGGAAEMLKILENSALPIEKTKQITSELRKQIEASFDILTSLLNWGKTQLQGVEAKPEIFSPKKVIRNNIEALNNQAKAKNIAIIDETQEQTSIYMDRDHFDFIIRNFLSNAIKFTHPNGTIAIKEAFDAKSNRTVFSVKDTGVGISEDQQKQFLRSNMNVSFGTKGEKGTGLGLLLSKEFIQANKGQLWLESQKGAGTTIYFSIP